MGYFIRKCNKCGAEPKFITREDEFRSGQTDYQFFCETPNHATADWAPTKKAAIDKWNKLNPVDDKKRRKVRTPEKPDEAELQLAPMPDVKDAGEIYENGCLLYIRIGKWNPESTLSKEFISDALLSEEDKKLIRSTNRIIEDDELLKEIEAIWRDARSEAWRWSVQYPIPSLMYIRLKHVPRLNAYLKECEERYWKKVDSFCERLFEEGGIIDQFAERHPVLYDRAVMQGAYPRSPADAKSRFSYHFSWRRLTLPEKSEVFSAEMIEDEIKKAKAEINEMKTNTMMLVKATLLDRLQKLQSQCANDKVNAGTVGAWNNWLNKFDELWVDFVWRDDLKKVVEDVRTAMSKASVDKLKGDEKFREKVGEQLQSALNELKIVPDEKPKRSLDL